MKKRGFWAAASLILFLTTVTYAFTSCDALPTQESFDSSQGLKTTSSSIAGVQRCCLILVYFPDRSFDPTRTPSYFSGLFDQFNQYWQTVSYSMISWQRLSTAGPYMLGRNMNYYGRGNASVQRTWQLVQDAITIADQNVDFLEIQYVFIIHAGMNEADPAGLPDDIWSGTYLTPLEPPFPRAPRWQTNEGPCDIPATWLSEYDPVGVWVHETGHMLGEPDLYNYDFNEWYEGIYDNFNGIWTIMAAGPDLDPPSYPSAYSLQRLGWMTKNGIVKPLQNADFFVWKRETTPPSTEFVHSVRVELSPAVYYLVETIKRPASGPDSSLPNEGVLISLINETCSPWPEGNTPYNPMAGQTEWPPMKVIDANPDDQPPYLDDATYINVGQFFNDSVNDIQIYVKGKSASGDYYQVRVENRFEGLPDLSVRAWNRGADSRDIWVDSSRNGWNNYTDVLWPESERLWITKQNRIYARIRNIGTEAATNINVSFYYANLTTTGLSPWGRMIDNETGTDFRTIPLLISNASQDVFITWVPPQLPLNYCCVRIKIDPPSEGEVTLGNNWAQENISQVDTELGSGWRPISGSFTVANPYTTDSARIQLFVLNVTGNLPDVVLKLSNGTVIEYPEQIVLPPSGIETIHVEISIPETWSAGDYAHILISEYVPSVPVKRTGLLMGLHGMFELCVSAKNPSHIYISIPKTKFRLGETIPISGSLIPAQGTDVGLYFTRLEDRQVYVEKTATDNLGTYTYSTTLPVGLYTLTASWEGDRYYSVDESTVSFQVVSGPVGGIAVPIEKLSLLAPYIGLTSTIIIATVATVICFRRVKRRREKQ